MDYCINVTYNAFLQKFFSSVSTFMQSFCFYYCTVNDVSAFGEYRQVSHANSCQATAQGFA